MSEDSLKDWKDDKLVKVYRKIRDAKEVEANAWKEREKELNSNLALIESELLERMKAGGQDGFTTKYGSVSKRVTTRMWPADWDVFIQFAKEYDGFDFLERRIHNGNLSEFIKKHPDVVVPVNVDQKYAVTIRKPTTKG
jgi:hypothetical protein